MLNFSEEDKQKIEHDIELDFEEALEGIKNLPLSSRGGVYLAYIYYYNLFLKIKSLPSSRILQERIRIPNSNKIKLMLQSILRNQLNLI